jgi:hypothetical protein
MTTEPDIDLTEDRLFSLGFGLIYKGVCAPKSWSKEKVEDEATKADPPGTSANRWVCSEISEDNPENPVPCNDDCNRVHWIVNC